MIANAKTPKTVLTECIASVLSRHTRVITHRVKEKRCCIALKMNFEFYQHLTLLGGMAGKKPDATYPVSIVFGSLCTSILYFNLKNKLLFVQHRKIS